MMLNIILVMFISGFVKIMYNSQHLLTMFIGLELVVLSLISLTWNSVWVQTMWFLVMSVVHSVFGMMLLLLIMRQLGNDKTLNVI
uniref:NADH dehydrogenase subunit 4L n=1 Tax=Trichuris muris TaxID=70415 RepID=A0A1E1GJ20_TRIMR|nr:NADH dehydrogenase subunit 4L [Trichuris muris]